MGMQVKIEEMIRIVKQARAIIADEQAISHVTVKGVADYATEVDIKVQETICQALAERYPQIQFMGEEKDNSGIDFSGQVWILDPVDGTTNLIHGYRQSAVSLALWEKGEVTKGVVYQPFTDELFYAQKGQGAWLDGKPIRVSKAERMEQCLISFGTTPYEKAEYAERNFGTIRRIFMDCQDIRRSGSAAIDLANVACGRTDAFFEMNLKPWDYAAGLVLIREAGGTVTDYEGGAVSMEHPCNILASNGKIGETLLKQYL